MADAITVSINKFSYEISDLINISKAAFTTITALHKLSNTYYVYWKALAKSYLKGQNL